MFFNIDFIHYFISAQNCFFLNFDTFLKYLPVADFTSELLIVQYNGHIPSFYIYIYILTLHDHIHPNGMWHILGINLDNNPPKYPDEDEPFQ